MSLLDRLSVGGVYDTTITYDTTDALALKTEAAYSSQNTTGIYANSAYIHANAAFFTANTVASNNTPTLAFLTANSAYLQANLGTTFANSAGSYANSAFIKANASYISQNTTGAYANAAYIQANTATTNAATADQRAVTSGVYANAAYTQANTADQRAVTSGVYANSAYSLANTKFSSSGGTISGSVSVSQDLSVSGNLSVSGQVSYINTTEINIGDNIINLNADLPMNQLATENAGIQVQRGTSPNTAILWNETLDRWTFTNDGTNYFNIGADSSSSYSNAAYVTANTGVEYATSAGVYANAAFSKANTADQRAVTSGAYANSAYGQANTATTNASTADQKAVSAGSYANSAYAHANTRFSSSGGTLSGALAVTGAITATGDITAYFSDDRLKDRLGNIENALDKIEQLTGFYYEANDLAVSMGYEKKREMGISAQDVNVVAPEVVCEAPINKEYLTVKYERLLPLVIEGIKELRREIQTLKMPK